MLRPTECITNRRTLVGTRSGNQGVRNFMKKRWRNAANFLYHLWRITSEVAAQSLENALRMLQGQIALGETKVSMALVNPGLSVVAALRVIPAGENARSAFFCIAKIVSQNAGCIREMNDVIAEEKVVLDNVPNESAKKRDVAAGADRHP